MGSATPFDSGSSDGPVSNPRILYPVFTDLSEGTFETARQIAAGVAGRLVVLDLVGPAEQVPRERREIAGTMLEAHLEDLDQIESSYHVEKTSTPVSKLTEYAHRHDISLVVFDDDDYPRRLTDLVRGPAPIRVSNQVPTDVVTVATGQPIPRASSILVGLAGGPHSELAVHVAGAIAVASGAALDLLHVSDSGQEETDTNVEGLFRQARQQLPEAVDVETWALPASDVTQTLLNQSHHYDLTVVGESQGGQLRRLLSSSRASVVREKAQNRVLTVRKAGVEGFAL